MLKYSKQAGKNMLAARAASNNKPPGPSSYCDATWRQYVATSRTSRTRCAEPRCVPPRTWSSGFFPPGHI